MKDGIIRPDQVTGTPYGSQTMQDVPTEDRRLDLRVLRKGARRARDRTPRRPAQPLPRRRGRRHQAAAHRDPRHLLLVPHRRARHGDRHARLHVLVPRPASRAAATSRRRSVADPRRGRGDAALGDTGAGSGPGRDQRHRARGLSDPQGRSGLDHPQLGEHRSGRVRRSRQRRLRPAHQPAPRVRRRPPSLPGLAPGPPGTAGRAARMAQADPGVLRETRAHARLHTCDPIDRRLPDGVHARRAA